MVRQVRHWLLALSAFIVLAGVFELPKLQAQAEQPEKKLNVILILLDQLQADRLHAYGNPRPTSPNIDSLAKRGVRFSHFYTVAPWTAPSDASLMTSLYPSRHGVSLFWQADNASTLVDPKTPMLAQVFQSHGYHTAAFVNNSVGGKPLTGRGFDEYHENAAPAQDIVERLPSVNGALRAPGTTQQVISWLDKNQSRPFFLWTLFLEPHSPYNPTPSHDLFKSDAYPNLSDDGYSIETAPLLRLAMLGDPKAKERLYQLYDGKIHYIDSYVGQILDHVKQLGLDKNTLIVLTSDHGELLFSHPQDFLTADHVSLYDPVMHVPLIISGPNVPQGKVIDALASNVDTSQTILNLAGLPQLSNADGVSLVPLIEGKAKSIHDYLWGEEDIVVPLRSVRNMQYKLIYNVWEGTKQLFDLQKDPKEHINIADQNPAVTQSFFEELQKRFTIVRPPSAEQIAHWKLFTRAETRSTPGASDDYVVDDQTVLGQFLITGSGWHSDNAPQSLNYNGGEYGTDDKLPSSGGRAGACFWTEPGDGSRTAEWRQENPQIGTYKIYIYFGKPAVGKLASDAVFTVKSGDRTKSVNVNFNESPGTWHLLGTFTNPRAVTVTNKADGIIIADAVKYERLNN